MCYVIMYCVSYYSISFIYKKRFNVATGGGEVKKKKKKYNIFF